MTLYARCRSRQNSRTQQFLHLVTTQLFEHPLSCLEFVLSFFGHVSRISEARREVEEKSVHGFIKRMDIANASRCGFFVLPAAPVAVDKPGEVI